MIFNYKSFLESIELDMTKQNLSDLLESLTIFQDNLLSSIKAEEMDLYDTLKLIRQDYGKLGLKELSDNPKFIDALSKMDLKKSELQDSSDFETFISKKTLFLPIFDNDANELMNPKYLLMQTYNDSSNKWNTIKLYSVNDDIKKFYDKLSSKTIEITNNNINYIYKTGNSGNNWELSNMKDKTDIFKRFLTDQDIHDISGMDNIKIKII